MSVKQKETIKLFCSRRSSLVNKQTFKILEKKFYYLDYCKSVSQWGHDFRPQYLNLGILKEKLANVPCIALTATATAEVITDIFK